MASNLHHLDSTLAIVASAVLLALIFQARVLDFQIPQARRPGMVFVVLPIFLMPSVFAEVTALLGMVARQPATLTKLSASGLVWSLVMLFGVVFLRWSEELRKHGEERNHHRAPARAEVLFNRASFGLVLLAVLATAAIWSPPWLWPFSKIA